MLAGLMMMAATAWGQESENDHIFIQGWNGHFAHGETVTLEGADLALEKSGLVSVTLGDHPDQGLCTKIERQTVYEWNDDSISFQVEAGDFTTGEPVYVFLIGEEGAASAGYAVTLGDQIPRPLGPGQPSQPILYTR
jgi:hypothetical protein